MKSIQGLESIIRRVAIFILGISSTIGCGTPAKNVAPVIEYSTFSPNGNYVQVTLELYSPRTDDDAIRGLCSEAFEKYPRGFFQSDGRDIEKISIKWNSKKIELSQGMLPVKQGSEENRERAFFEKFRTEVAHLASTRLKD